MPLSHALLIGNVTFYLLIDFYLIRKHWEGEERDRKKENLVLSDIFHKYMQQFYTVTRANCSSIHLLPLSACVSKKLHWRLYWGLNAGMLIWDAHVPRATLSLLQTPTLYYHLRWQCQYSLSFSKVLLGSVSLNFSLCQLYRLWLSYPALPLLYRSGYRKHTRECGCAPNKLHLLKHMVGGFGPQAVSSWALNLCASQSQWYTSKDLKWLTPWGA